MESVILVIHLILALGIIILVLLQRSEGGGLGIGGGGGGLGGLASARGTANVLTKMTGLVALGFFITSLTLGVLAGGQNRTQGILDDINIEDVAPSNTTIDAEAPVGVKFVAPSTIENSAKQAVEDVVKEVEAVKHIKPAEDIKTAPPTE